MENADMNSIENFSGKDGIKKLKELIESTRMCHFVTQLNDRPLSSRPMSTQQVDDEGNIWFFSGKSSNKNASIKISPEAHLFYASPSNSEYLSVYGYAEILVDREKIDELWSSFAKTWFNEGKEDPELTLIKIVPSDAHYWDTKHNKAVQLVKILAGSMLGKQLDDGVEGDITL